MADFSEKINCAGAYTFDDFLLVPGASSIMPDEVNVSTNITKNIRLNIPVLSAAMDTVTETIMAIEMARSGGLGVIHRNLTAEKQCDMIRKIKRSESLIIKDVVTVSPLDNIEAVESLAIEKNITGFPVIDGGRLIGIITSRDMRFEENKKKLVSDVMTKDVVTADMNIDINDAIKILHSNRIEKLPLVDKEGRLSGLVTVKDIMKRKKYPSAARDSNERLLAAAAVGIDYERVNSLLKAGCDLIVIDTAHGHNEKVIQFVKKIKNDFGCDVIAGNIATKEAAADLISAGADCVKVGVGPGSICTTRIVAGVGVPQLTAIADVADVSKGNAYVIADGGIRYPSDIAKSIAVGADAIMMGNILAGTDEAPGDVVLMEGKKYKKYRGMGSKAATADRYFQKSSKFVPEGVEGLVPYKGSVSDIIFSFVGGLRSSMGYVGAKNIKEMKEKAKMVRTTSHGMVESHPHDIIVTDESWMR